MKRTPAAIAAMLALGMVLARNSVGGGPHGYEPPIRAEDLMAPDERRVWATGEMEAWLRRLAGRYYEFNHITIRGVLKNEDLSGRRPDGKILSGYLDCAGVGSGPGVFCMIMQARHYPGRGDSASLRGIIEFGLDPNASKIHFLWAEADGTVQDSSAALHVSESLHDNWAKWWFTCPPPSPADFCYRTERVSLSADGAYITWTSGRFTKDGGGATSRYLYRLSPERARAAFGPDGVPHTMADPNTGSVKDFGLRPPTPGPR